MNYSVQPIHTADVEENCMFKLRAAPVPMEDSTAKAIFCWIYNSSEEILWSLSRERLFNKNQSFERFQETILG